MIQPLRTAHRRVFVTLAFLLPAVLLLGLGARRPRVVADAAGQMPSSLHLMNRSDNLWQKHAIATEFYNDPAHAKDVYVVLREQQESNEPDLLLYWSASEPNANVLPADARQIGGFANGKAFLLAVDEWQRGYLILFSLAHQTVFDTAALEKLP